MELCFKGSMENILENVRIGSLCIAMYTIVKISQFHEAKFW